MMNKTRWEWKQPKDTVELLARLRDAQDITVPQREYENLCGCAFTALAEARSTIARQKIEWGEIHGLLETERAEARAALAEKDTTIQRLEQWVPTPANVNALPEPFRRYIHDLETRCDPAGDVRELIIARDTTQALEARVKELEAEHRRLGASDADSERWGKLARMRGRKLDEAESSLAALRDQLALAHEQMTALDDALVELDGLYQRDGLSQPHARRIEAIFDDWGTRGRSQP